MPVYFDSIPFSWTLIGLAVLAVIYAVRTYLAYRRLPQEAADDWDYQVSQDMQDLRLTKDAYIRAYSKVNAPRGALYIASVLGLILVLTPIAFTLINIILWSLWSASGDPIEIKVGAGKVNESVDALTYEPGNMVWGFFTYFGIIAIWAFIAAIAARRFYRNAPGLMRDELIYERSGFLPTRPLTVGANPAHLIAWPTKGNEHYPSRRQYAQIFEDALGLTRSQDDDFMGTGFSCDIYTDGSEMHICVHTAHEVKVTSDDEAGAVGPGEELSHRIGFTRETHPFFFKDEFARDDDKDLTYTIIALLDDAQASFEKIVETGISMNKITGSEASRMRSFWHDKLEFYLYNKAH